MSSKTSLLAAVKELRWKEVAGGLADNPALLRFRDAKGRNWLHLCGSVNLQVQPALDAKNSIKVAKVLLESGLDINDAAFREGSWRATALWYAIAHGRNLPLATYFLEQDSDPNHCLWAAAFNNDVEAIRVLARYGAEIDPGTDTPFLAAIHWGRFEAADELLKLGANVNAQGKLGVTVYGDRKSVV